MHEETANELGSAKGHNLPLIVIPVVAPFECNIAVFDTKNAVVGYSDAVRVPSKVIDNTGGRFEWRFAVDNPFLQIALLQQIHEVMRFMQIFLYPEKVKFLCF